MHVGVHPKSYGHWALYIPKLLFTNFIIDLNDTSHREMLRLEKTEVLSGKGL